MIKFRRIRAAKIAVAFFSVFLMSYLIFSSNNSVYLNEEFAKDFQSHDSAEKKPRPDEDMGLPADDHVPRRIQQRTIPEIPVTKDKKFSQFASANALKMGQTSAARNLSGQIFSPNITKSRIDTLFRILIDKEEKYADILDQLGMITY